MVNQKRNELNVFSVAGGFAGGDGHNGACDGPQPVDDIEHSAYPPTDVVDLIVERRFEQPCFIEQAYNPVGHEK